MKSSTQKPTAGRAAIVGIVGFYRPDPSGPKAVNVVLDLLDEKVVVYEFRSDLQFEIDIADWMSLEDMKDELIKLVNGDAYADNANLRRLIIDGRIEALADAVRAKDVASDRVAAYRRSLAPQPWIRSLANEILAGDDECLLDEIVSDEFSAHASGINNEGVIAQLNYLASNGWTEEMVRKEAGL